MDDLNSKLFKAIKEGNKTTVKLLLDSGAVCACGCGADPNDADGDDRTPLMIAAAEGHEQIVKLLLDSGADINKVDEYGETPLFTAAAEGHEQIVKLLLDSGADINKTNEYGETPLYIAAVYGYDQIVKLLLDATYNDIADKVLVAVSQQDIIFDTAFIIFKKTVEETITFEGFNMDDDSDTHKKLYNVFQVKFSKYTKK